MSPGRAPVRQACLQPAPALQCSAGRWSCMVMGVIRKRGKEILLFFPSICFNLPCSFLLPSLPFSALIQLPSLTTYMSIISPVFKLTFSGVSSDYSSLLRTVPLTHVVGFYTTTSITASAFSGLSASKRFGLCQCCFSSSTGINSHHFQFQIRTFRKRVASLRSSFHAYALPRRK